MPRTPFKKEDRYVWEDHHACYVCHKNTATDLHHIISSSDLFHVPGKFNGSILNSAPLCNYPCHVGNDAMLAKRVTEFLNRTKNWIDSTDYELTDRDRKFLQVYNDLYNDHS